MKARRAHAGGDLLVSASDLMASLVFIFVIVAVVFAFRAMNAERDAREAARQKKDESERLQQANRDVRGATEARSALLKRVGEFLTARNVKVEVTADGIRLPSEVLFASGKDTLQPGASAKLEELGRALVEVLPCFVAAETNPEARCATSLAYARGVDAILVEGHTDRRPFTVGGIDRNPDLSAGRALAAYREMLRAEVPRTAPDGGVIAVRLAEYQNVEGQPLLGVAGYGSSRPTEPGVVHPEDYERDRRIEVRILMAPPVVVDGGL